MLDANGRPIGGERPIAERLPLDGSLGQKVWRLSAVAVPAVQNHVRRLLDYPYPNPSRKDQACHYIMRTSVGCGTGCTQKGVMVWGKQSTWSARRAWMGLP